MVLHYPAHKSRASRVDPSDTQISRGFESSSIGVKALSNKSCRLTREDINVEPYPFLPPIPKFLSSFIIRFRQDVRSRWTMQR
eukprot:3188023-Rhodomonas_salina.1